MRANTSLMAHILGSHLQISGYYEMHLSYRSGNDLLKQEQLYARNESIASGSLYLFDKLLHNDYQLLLDGLGTMEIKTLVSIRPAEQAIKSIINLFAGKQTGHPYADPHNAARYYIERLAELAKFCGRYQGRYYYYDADLIRSHPDQCLERMQRWLGLETPLKRDYQLFSQTGKPGAGDSSAKIRHGRIDSRQTDYPGIEVTPHLLREAAEACETYRPLILKYAQDSMVPGRL